MRIDTARFLVSLPERAVRSATAVSAGILRELGDAALPGSLRRTKLYRTMVRDTLRFLLEEVGQVDGAYPVEGRLGEKFALRRAAGNGIEIVGILAFRASPVWVMAALADLTGTGRKLVREIADSLKEEGLLDPGAEFDSVERILEGLEATSEQLTDTINAPPLDVTSLKKEWAELRKRAARIPPSRLPSVARLRTQWQDLRNTAEIEGRSIFQVSSLMALSAIEQVPDRVRWLSRSASVAARRTGSMLAEPLLDHYVTTLGQIRSAGFMPYWKRQFAPYLRAAAAQFSERNLTLTERLLGRSRAR
ncbi:MAG: hypothetical protein O7A63_05455 [Acidobacteria bacterium]|nr:hypothetical protein [Acidobacteriota bacterium]